jgi:hypothetical protein
MKNEKWKMKNGNRWMKNGLDNEVSVKSIWIFSIRIQIFEYTINNYSNTLFGVHKNWFHTIWYSNTFVLKYFQPWLFKKIQK